MVEVRQVLNLQEFNLSLNFRYTDSAGKAFSSINGTVHTTNSNGHKKYLPNWLVNIFLQYCNYLSYLHYQPTETRVYPMYFQYYLTVQAALPCGQTILPTNGPIVFRCGILKATPNWPMSSSGRLPNNDDDFLSYRFI